MELFRAKKTSPLLIYSRMLREKKESIIESWQARVYKEIPAAQHQTESELRNSLPQFLDRLSNLPASESTQSFSLKDVKDVSEDHGKQRASLSEYTLHQMLAEYRILREEIFEHLEQTAPIPRVARDHVLSSIEQGMAEAGARFMNAMQKQQSIFHERYRLVVESIRDHAIIHTDCDGIITEWHSGAEKILGYKREEMIGKKGSAIFVPEDLVKGMDVEEMKVARIAGKAENQRWHVKKDGSRFFANGVMNPIIDEDGEHVGYVKVFRDQTEELLFKEEKERLLKRESQLLHAAEASREELHDFIMQSPTGMVIVSGPDHKFTLANPMYEKLVGRKVVGKIVLEAFTEEEVAYFIPLLDSVYRTGVPYIGREIPLNIPDESGKIQNLFVNISYHPFRDFDGKIKGILAMAQDVTEQVLARKWLEESDRRYREIANTLPTIIWTATPDGFVDWYSDWWYKYTGYPHGTCWDDPDKLPMHPEDVARTRPLWSQALQSGKTFEMEQRFRRGSDAQYRWHMVRGVPVRDSEGRITRWIGSNADIHDHKLALEKLEQERDLREKFVATLSHDLRTPLAAAKMSAQMIERNTDIIPANRKLAHRIVDNMDRADNMIRDLLDANRIRAGENLPIELSDCDVTEVVKSTLDELTSLHGNRFHLVAPEKVMVRTSPEGLRRILENLGSNAIKYGARDQLITVILKVEGTELSLSVHNWGNPISEEDQKQLFEPYIRTESAEVGKEKGWGLGLTLVKGLADALGGAATVYSSKTHGTTFTVHIPGVL